MNRILVTGARGFIGKNLIAELKNRKAGEILEFDKDNSSQELDLFASECNMVFHLAGVNRPTDVKEFEEGNLDFTNSLLSLLKRSDNKAPVIFSSSTQALLDNPYGRSKLSAENTLRKYAEETGVPVSVYRLPNVFGKWCRPSYNSVVATFCHNIANDLPIQINDPETTMRQIYVMDVVNEFIKAAGLLQGKKGYKLIEDISPVYTVKLGEMASLIRSFRDERRDLLVPDQSDPFTKKLYATYLSYLPVNQFSYPLNMKSDERGSFTEFIRTNERGQVSVNISRPGITKGNHWHHTKNEKFLVVSGKGVIRFRKLDSSEVIEYFVDGHNLTVVDIPTGYTHNIENLGSTDMITIMWANESFDPENPDTYFEKV